MTAVEIIALIFVIFSIVKLITIAVNPRAWYGPANPLIKLVSSGTSATVFSLVLAVIVLFYLLAELNIVQIFAVVVFTFFLLMLTMASNIKKIIEAVASDLEKESNLLTKYWFPTVIWIGLMAWVLWEIFI